MHQSAPGGWAGAGDEQGPEGAGRRDSSASGVKVSEGYKMFLAGMLCNGMALTGRQLEMLAKYRNSNDISDAQHDATLKSLGFSKAEFDMLVKEGSGEGGGGGGGGGGGDDEDMCKICFVERINAVILPCGHFVTCMQCGRHLGKCPICRVMIQKVQQIFRA